jgi:hypothetical protein
MRRSELAHALRAMTAAHADPARISRGRRYAREGAVGSLRVEPGRIRATVQGSRPAPYQVTVGCRPADDGTRATIEDALGRGLPVAAAVDDALLEGFDVVPQSYVSSCNCPDWEDPCKHAVAVLTEFADLASDRPELLLHWRSVDTGAVEPAGATEGADRRAVARALLERMGASSRGAPPPTETLADPFFTGSVPASGPVLEGMPTLTPRPNPFRKGQIVIEGVDVGLVLAELISMLGEVLEEHT